MKMSSRCKNRYRKRTPIWKYVCRKALPKENGVKEIECGK